MTDNDIIKALENCSTKGFCKYINYCENAVLYNNLLEHAVALLKRQKAEIERLKTDNVLLKSDVHADTAEIRALRHKLEISKFEAVKEFAGRLKPNERQCCMWCAHSNNGNRTDWCDEDVDNKTRCLGFSEFESKIDNLVKEMVGDD